MEETLTLSWNAHQDNICKGLSLLQQRGEFVDMTLAADGHHVKVHQMVLSLASPYIKDLISTAQCPHPVIFLNNIKYATLCAILEYAYTGEALIPKDILPDLIAAGKALHIKGLQEMEDPYLSELNENKIVLENESQNTNESYTSLEKEGLNVNLDLEPTCKVFVSCGDDNECSETDMEILTTTKAANTINQTEPTEIDETELIVHKKKPLGFNQNRLHRSAAPIQYTISNQGNLQVVVNRFIYNLKYVQKNLNKYWRCVDYAYRKCPANVYTNTKNQVLKRRGNHNHPFHDQKIMKKSRMRLIFGAYKDAEDKARSNLAADDVE